jgi:hypothetical protein
MDVDILFLLHNRYHIPPAGGLPIFPPHSTAIANISSQVVIGNIDQRPVIRSTYFFRLDLANIIPVSTGSSIQLVNSLARSLGLHDYYLVGMWNFCEGYNDEGVVYCSPPQTLYWFNPVEILLNELLSGATIVLPADINDILELIRLASNLMFGFFLTGLLMNFVSIFLAPLAIYSRWWSLPLAIWTFITALLSTAATIIATVMFIIFRNTITSQEGINIGAELGNVMFGFMWTGAAFSIFGFVIHLGMSCCCASRRDVRTGRRKGSKKAYASEDGVMRQEKSAGGSSGKGRMGWMRRKKTSGHVV